MAKGAIAHVRKLDGLQQLLIDHLLGSRLRAAVC